MGELERLVAIGGPPLCTPVGTIASDALSEAELRRCGLLRLLRLKNGFYAFEGALHVYPSTSGTGEIGLEEWNSSTIWLANYQGLASGCFFFAEDVFGGQFCLYDGAVMSFDPETGEKNFVAADVEGWAQQVLGEPEVLTGYPLAPEWQSKHGVIPHGKRLMPKVPFARRIRS